MPRKTFIFTPDDPSLESVAFTPDESEIRPMDVSARLQKYLQVKPELLKGLMESGELTRTDLDDLFMSDHYWHDTDDFDY